jgi:hypothetical protein
MLDRSSSKAYWLGYELWAQSLPESDNPEANGWEIRILAPDHQPIISDAFYGPFPSLEAAENAAELAVRRHRETRDLKSDPDDKSVWARKPGA